METIEQVRRWLEGADDRINWTVDSLSKRSYSGGVFPQGTKILSRTVDILGNRRDRLADSYLIKLRLPAAGERDGAQNAGLINALVESVRQFMTPGKVSLASSDGSTAVYQLTLTVEYQRCEPNAGG